MFNRLYTYKETQNIFYIYMGHICCNVLFRWKEKASKLIQRCVYFPIIAVCIIYIVKTPPV